MVTLIVCLFFIPFSYMFSCLPYPNLKHKHSKWLIIETCRLNAFCFQFFVFCHLETYTYIEIDVNENHYIYFMPSTLTVMYHYYM